uniref:Uncharacterized protein n=1 Tax=Kalanchoe fedtschenkoi TaxID=63787 RepID=A0A7N0T5J1_KALFE
MFKMRGADQSSMQQQKCGWNRTSQDYNNHLMQMMRSATIREDVPLYPSVHHVFKKKAAATTAQEPPSATAKKQVRIAEQEKTGAAEERVDEEDADLAQQKQKGFELCKWTTFKKAR